MRSEKFYWLTIIVWYFLVLPLILAKQYNADDDHPPPKQRQKQQQQQQQQRFTVQFRSPPGDQRSIDEQDAFLNYLEQHGNGLNVTVRYRFHDVLNGMSIQLNAPLMPSSNQSNYGLDNNFRAASTADQENGTTSGIHPSVFLAQTLSSCPYVNRYWPGKRYARPNVERSPERFTSSVVDTGLPNLHVAHSMTTVDRVRVENGLTGKGIKVGILDTGIDYTHPALGGCFGDGCRVAYGYDLVGDSYGETTDKVAPDNDPMDEFDGHGTHVSGIIGAHDTIKGFEGVAPNVTFGAWRIFGRNGGTDDDIILMAAEMAVKAGMDIINLSLGGGIGAWEEDPLAVALSNIADQGVFVSVAQGNEGRDGIERTPSPAVGDHVLAVASMDNGKKLGNTFTISSTADNNTANIYEYTMSDAKDKFTTNHTIFPIMTVISNQTSNEASLGCAPISNDLTGHIVLLRRGQCEFGQKAMHVQNAGGIGLLVYSDPGNGAVEIDLRRYTRVNIPVASISGDNGTQIFHLLTTTTTTEAKNNNNMIIKFSEQLVKIDTGGLPSIFSTWGPDPELHLKPDIAGIGGSVYSTYPQALGGYMLMSGTSMAAPYLAGTIALYMQAKGHRDRSTIVSALLNTAAPTSASIDFPNILQSPIKQGAGLVQIYDAIHTTVQIEPYKIALNDTAHFQRNITLTIRNLSPNTETFQLSHLPATSIEGFNLHPSAVPVTAPNYKNTHASVTFDQTKFIIEGNKKISVNVYFDPPQENITEHMLYGGYIELSSNNSAPSSRVPYFGSLGNQYDLPIFDVSNEFPFIGDYYGRTTMQNRIYNFKRRDSLFLYVRIANPTRIFKAELLDAASNVSVGSLPGIHGVWLPRNDHTKENHKYVYEWRGGIHASSSPRRQASYRSVSRGRYRIRLSALRIFGNHNVKKDWHVWESPEFRVQ